MSSLFWVICRVSKNPRKDSSIHSVVAFDHDTVPIRINKLIIQQDAPKRMEKFTFAMSEDVFDVLLLDEHANEAHNGFR